MAAQLSIAANRVATIERIHRRLHNNDGAQTVAFRKYLEEFCRDFSGILNSEDQIIRVEGAEVMLPAATAIPLGFIVNELVTNAVKYGKGNIRVRLDDEPGGGHVLSVSNWGPAMPQGYDPASSKGLGMRIVQSFARKIGGKLLFARDEGDQGARISILFS
jgi:two-component sensor histidine kinase